MDFDVARLCAKAIAGVSLALLVLAASPADAQTAQLIVTGTPGSDGLYAAVTYDVTPSDVTWTTPVSQGNFFVYDGVNCSTHTLTKPIAGSGAGKVALLTGSYPSSCTYYDDIVRELEADGVVAVVFGFTNGAWRTRILHGNPTGLTVPVLYMQVDEVSQSIRSAVLGGATVEAAFVAVPEMVMYEDVDWFLPGETRPLTLVPLGKPSAGASWDLSTFDVDRTIAGSQHSFTFPGTSVCSGVSYNWNADIHLLTATVPSDSTYTGVCTKTYLIRDTAGYQDIGLVSLYIGVPYVRTDTANTAPGIPVAIDVLANDWGDPSVKVASRIDLNPSTTAVDQLISNAGGTWSVTGNTVTFAPAPGIVGFASIPYVVRGANGGSSNTAFVNVYIDKPTLDVDASLTETKYDALSDGLLVIRYLFGLTGSSLSAGALGGTATRTDPATIKAYLDGIRPMLDVDGNGEADALTDGLLIVRYLFGLRGDALVAGALDPLATRTAASEIEAYIQNLMP